MKINSNINQNFTKMPKTPEKPLNENVKDFVSTGNSDKSDDIFKLKSFSQSSSDHKVNLGVMAGIGAGGGVAVASGICIVLGLSGCTALTSILGFTAISTVMSTVIGLIGNADFSHGC